MILSYLKTLLINILTGVPYGISPRCQARKMSSDTYRLLAYTLCKRFPETLVHCQSDRPIAPHSFPLKDTAMFFEYVIMNSKRIFASHTVGLNKSSLVHVHIPGPSPKDGYSEVLEIIQINQNFQNVPHPLWLARLRWFVLWCGGFVLWCGEQPSIWDDL